jgi:hypothetical protein
MLPKGLALDAIDKNAFLGNVFRRREAWEVRPGFGQMAQFDTTWLGQAGGARGYVKQLGSYALKTSWGAVQIISVFTVLGQTATTTDQSQYITSIAVNIYDTDTGRRWEEILHKHTAERNESFTSMPAWRGNYNSNWYIDRQSWVIGTDDDHVFFTPFGDRLLFGNRNIGLWAYVPIDIDQTRSAQIDSTRNERDCSPYSESSRCVRVYPTAGGYDFSYLDSAGWPAPVDCAVIEGRLAIAAEREVYVSDPGRPNAIIGTNVIVVPCRERITAVAEVAGTLVIMTPNETWGYRFGGAGAEVTKGARISRISDSNGCLGPRAKIKIDETLVFCDANGVYSCSGGTQLQSMSKPIQPLFESEEGISLPLSSFYANEGLTDVAYTQPRSFLRWDASKSIHMAYEADLDVLLIGLPSQGSALCMSRGAWSVWTLESLCSERFDRVEELAFLPEPNFCAADGRLFAVAGPEVFTPNDEVAAEPNNATSSSCIIAEWGRGGGLDRSVSKYEDMRVFDGHYGSPNILASSFTIGPPQVLPIGTPLPRGGAAVSEVYLFPVLFKTDSGAPATPDTLTMHFTFDNNLWKPIFTGAIAGELDFSLPAERLAAKTAYGWGAPTVTNQVCCYLVASGLVDENGDEIRMDITGGAVPAVWTHAPNFNMADEKYNPVIWLPFEYIGTPAQDVMSLGLLDTGCTWGAGVAGGVPELIWWRAAALNRRHDLNNVAQPVDWIIKTDRFKDDSGSQIRMRNILMRILSHGQAPEKAATWQHGLLNVAFQADWRDWSGQILDMTTYNVVNAKATLRSRVMSSSSVVVQRLFGNGGGVGNLKWGSSGTIDGNYLVDDEQVDTLVSSASLRGERVAVMLFGHIRGRAERLVVDSMDATIKVVGAARRWGR